SRNLTSNDFPEELRACTSRKVCRRDVPSLTDIGNRPPIHDGIFPFFFVEARTSTCICFTATSSRLRPENQKVSPGFNRDTNHSSIDPRYFPLINFTCIIGS